MSAVCLFGCAPFVAYGCRLYVCCLCDLLVRCRQAMGCGWFVCAAGAVAYDGRRQCAGASWGPRGVPCYEFYTVPSVREGMCLVNVWLIIGALSTGPFSEDHRSVVRYQTPIMVAEVRTKARIHQNLGRFHQSESSLTPECEPRHSLKYGRLRECLSWGCAQKVKQTENSTREGDNSACFPVPRNEATSHQNRSFGLYTHVSCRASFDT